MAILHQATLQPSKLELLTSYLNAGALSPSDTPVVLAFALVI